MSDKDKLKPFPRFESDEAAEAFVETADLSEYDFSDMQRTRFEFAAKGARVNIRLPVELLDAVKATAAQRGMPYQRFIRQALENAISPGKGGCVMGTSFGDDLIESLRQAVAHARRVRCGKELTVEELAALPDADIDYSDIPEADDAFWSKARVVMPARSGSDDE